MKTTAIPVTQAKEFRTVMVGLKRRKLFSVNPDLPVLDVLQEASCILESARGVIQERPAEEGLEESTKHAVENLLDQVAACLEAILSSPGMYSLEAPLIDEGE